jgi:phage shock protein A
MSEPSKEAMEKAEKIVKTPSANTNYFTLARQIALEFTNYQKRIEELEEFTRLALVQGNHIFAGSWVEKKGLRLLGCENTDQLHLQIINLAKGVKEG